MNEKVIHIGLDDRRSSFPWSSAYSKYGLFMTFIAVATIPFKLKVF